MSVRLWLEAKALHGVARAALRLQPPLRAKRIVDAVGRLLPTVDVATARQVAATLAGKGTCLTRALAIAARLPRAEIVIAVAPAPSRTIHAHAWVSVDGAAIGEETTAGDFEIARLSRG